MDISQLSIEQFSEEKYSGILSELTELIHEAYKPLADMGFKYSGSHQPSEITLKRLNRGHGFLAFWDKQLVGTISLFAPLADNACEYYRQEGVYHFGQFAVRPQFQNKGIGQKLLSLVEAKARAAGGKELSLDTAEGALELIKKYERHGFQIVSTTQWSTTNYHSVVMSKKI